MNQFCNGYRGPSFKSGVRYKKLIVYLDLVFFCRIINNISALNEERNCFREKKYTVSSKPLLTNSYRIQNFGWFNMLGNIKLRKLNSNLRETSFKAKSTFPKTHSSITFSFVAL